MVNHLQNNNNNKDLDNGKKPGTSGSDCTSSTECSEDSDRHSDNLINDKKVFNSDSKNVPTPAPRTTLEKQSKSSLQGSLRSISVERVKQVRHESLV